MVDNLIEKRFRTREIHQTVFEKQKKDMDLFSLFIFIYQRNLRRIIYCGAFSLNARYRKGEINMEKQAYHGGGADAKWRLDMPMGWQIASRVIFAKISQTPTGLAIFQEGAILKG